MSIFWQIKSIFLLFFCLASFHLWSQESDSKTQFEIQKFGVDDGFSSRFIHKFLQDNRGFLWVGTDYGLNRFDGFRFKTYTQEQDGLQSNQIANMLEDLEGNLWLTSSAPNRFLQVGTVEIFNPISEKSIALEKWAENPEILNGETITGMYSADGKSIYFSCLSGKILLCENRKLSVYAQLPASFEVHELQIAQNGALWLNTEKEIIFVEASRKWQVIAHAKPNHLFDFVNQKAPQSDFVYYKLGYQNKGVSDEPIIFGKLFATGKQEEVFRISPTYLPLRVDIEQKQALVIRNYDFSVGKLFADNKGSEEFEDFGVRIREISTAGISLTDSQGGFWKDNPPYGIVRIQPVATPFRTFLTNRPTPFQPTTATRKILADSLGNILLMSRREFLSFSMAQKDSVTSLQLDKLGFEKEYTFLNALQEADSLFVSTSHGGLFSKKKNHFQLYDYSGLGDSDLESVVSKTWHWSIFRSKNGRLWLGHQFGLSYLNESDGKIHIYEKLNGFEEFRQATVYQFHENSQGIWLATSLGLYLLDSEKGIQQRFHSGGVGKNYLPHNQINHLYEDSEGVFWLATKGGGLIRWNPETGESAQFTAKNGLSHNVLYAVYEDDFNNLWLSSNWGIMRFEKETGFVTTYLTSDGISHEEFNRVSHFQDWEGKIYFGGLDGITVFDPTDFQNNSDKSKNDFLRFTKLQIQDENNGSWKDFTSQFIESQQIIVNPSDLGFRLEFADLDFRNDSKKQFAYRIAGLEKGWHYQRNNSIRVGKLPYGDFELQLKSQNKNGVWGAIRTAKIRVIKPFYLETWFFALVLVGLIGLIFLIVKWRTRKLEKDREVLENEFSKRTFKIEQDKKVIEAQAEELAQLDQMKSRFFTNISHELRTPLTLILGPAKQAQSNQKPLEPNLLKTFRLIEQNGEDLLKLVEEILELSKLESSEVETKLLPTDLSALLSRIYGNFEAKAESLGIALNLENWKGNKTILIDSNKVEKVVNNLISNALKFTPKGGKIEIAIHFKKPRPRQRLQTLPKVGFKSVQRLAGPADSASDSLVCDDKLPLLKITISDTGKGVSPENLPKLFNRFYQTKSAENSGGTGIGLALSKELAEVMGGSLEVESELGKGSQFSLLIPLVESEEIILVKEETNSINTEIKNSESFFAKSNRQNKNAERVLIVEDNFQMQDFIAELLSDTYHVSVANNGKQALQQLETAENPFDLIVSDVMMPEMNGFELLESLKASEKWKQIPVVMLTSLTAESDRLQALQTGVDDYLTKPFSPPELLARVRNLIGNYQEKQIWQEAFKEEQIHQKELDLLSVANPTHLVAELDREIETESDYRWLKIFEEIVIQSIGHHYVSTSDLAEEMGLSQRQLGRKLKTLTGLTPLKYQQEVQLQQARKLLESGTFGTVSDISEKSGFQTPAYFSRLYAERFGKRPSEY